MGFGDNLDMGVEESEWNIVDTKPGRGEDSGNSDRE